MVYITGDMHADFSRFSAPEMRPLKKGDTLIVCGDFGFLWSGGRAEQKVLKKLTQLPYTILFLDDTHENFDLLRDYPVTEWNGGRVQEVRANIRHLLRGEIYEIENESYFVFGGGETADPSLRTGTDTWWEEEMPSEEEMLHGLKNLEDHGNRVDYILTHEPSGKACAYSGGPNARLDGVNIYLNQIEDKVQYERWFFGSLHLDKVLSKRHLAVFRKVIPVHPPTGRRGR